MPSERRFPLMKIVVSLDSFKGSLSSLEAGAAVRSGILSVFPDDHVLVFPLADGGEGTVDALTSGLGGTCISVTVIGPLGTKIHSRFGWLEETRTAIIEMADAAGLVLVPESQRNPLQTTSYGVGELIAAAYAHGARHFLIGIGGSATNDCGLGMLAALGVKFAGVPDVPLGRDLACVRSIDARALTKYQDCRFDIACDVKNPLCGETGCSQIFAPQKGSIPRGLCPNGSKHLSLRTSHGSGHPWCCNRYGSSRCWRCWRTRVRLPHVPARHTDGRCTTRPALHRH